MYGWLLLTLATFALGCSSTEPSVDSSPDLYSAPAIDPCVTATAACRATVVVGNGKVLPYYRTFELGPPNGRITRAVLIVHGDSRDVKSYFETMAAAAQTAGRDGTTEIIAPYFQTDPTTLCSDQMDQPGPTELYWSCNGWKDGRGAINDTTLYSFSAIDVLLNALKGSFPNLTQIVVAGFSAGGQFTQRYAASNKLDPSLGIPLRYVVGSPSSYLYLDGKRLTVTASCSDQNNCALNAASFVSPFFDSASCPSYDSYKYGLQNLTGYLASLSLADIVRQYPQRDVFYLLAALDSGPTSIADYSVLDTNCAADAQGPLQGITPDRHSFRLQRGLTFQAYMKSIFAARHGMSVVPGCGHSQNCVFSSETGRNAIFQ